MRLEFETIEDTMPGYGTTDLDVVVSTLESAREELEDNIRKDVIAMGDDAPRRIGAISRPDYYVNGTPVGNRTYLATAEDFFFHGQEPRYVSSYKSARWRSYKSLLDRSIDRSDFVDFMDFATSHDDPYFAQHFAQDLTTKKEGPVSYVWTPEYVIEKAEKKRIKKNKQVEVLHQSIKGHNKKAARGELDTSKVEVSENLILSNLVQHGSWLTRRGYAKYLGNAFLAPLVQASHRPIIEKQILDKILQDEGLPANSISEVV